MRVLGIETSCDETAVSLVKSTQGRVKVLANVISSQVELHKPFGGVVPELATREHLRNLPRLVSGLFEETGFSLNEVDALAVTEGPGLASALLVGNAYARALAVAAAKPIYGINHLEGHLFSPFFSEEREVEFPFVGLIVSGGHTLLIQALGWDHYVRIGSTIDDAAGEAFDKVARLLGFSYPGGPLIEKAAQKGRADAYDFPRSLLKPGQFDFSFSGLKTAVRYLYEKHPERYGDEAWIADLAASFQKAVVDVLVQKSKNAVIAAGVKTLVAAGGVLSNGVLRHALEQECAAYDIELFLADRTLCMDNAAMIAATAAQKLEAGLPPAIHEDCSPHLSLFTIEPGRNF